MIFRKANGEDLQAISAIYKAILDLEAAGKITVGWMPGVYPTEATARAALANDDLYVAEEDGKILASARINDIQVPEYANARWSEKAPEDQVLVLHTLTVLPEAGGSGIGTAFVRFYEQMAQEQGRPFLRMDTNERNQTARKLYARLGYREADIVPCVFNGIPGVQLVCLEKKLS